MDITSVVGVGNDHHDDSSYVFLTRKYLAFLGPQATRSWNYQNENARKQLVDDGTVIHRGTSRACSSTSFRPSSPSMTVPVDPADAILDRQFAELGWSLDHWKTIMRAQAARRVVELWLFNPDKSSLPTKNVIAAPSSGRTG